MLMCCCVCVFPTVVNLPEDFYFRTAAQGRPARIEELFAAAQGPQHPDALLPEHTGGRFGPSQRELSVVGLGSARVGLAPDLAGPPRVAPGEGPELFDLRLRQAGGVEAEKDRHFLRGLPR